MDTHFQEISLLVTENPLFNVVFFEEAISVFSSNSSLSRKITERLDLNFHTWFLYFKISLSVH